MNAEEATHGDQRTTEVAREALPYARWIAVVVLIPTVPMLLLSVAALGLFYVAPTRFGGLIARLPGDDFIRTALVFAPVTLLAIVILALLYALDRPARSQVAMIAPEGTLARRVRAASGARAATGLLLLSLPMLLISLTVWVLSFVAPGRFGSFIARLPGESYLRLIVRVAPVGLFLVVLLAAFFALLGRGGEKTSARQVVRGNLVRLSVALSVVPAVPLLLLSLLALVAFRFAPGRFASLMAWLPSETFLRLALLSAPLPLVVIVVLAVLYLWSSSGEPAGPPTVEPAWLIRLRQAMAISILVGGLAFTAMMGLGLLAVLLLLVWR